MPEPSRARRLAVFAPLLLFAGYGVAVFTAAGDRPFFLRWIDFSMAFFIALVACWGLKRLLLDAPGDHRGDPGDGDDDRRDT